MAYLWKQISIPATTTTGDFYTKPSFKISPEGTIILATERISDVTTAGPYTVSGFGDAYDNFGNPVVTQFATGTGTVPDASALTAFKASNRLGLSLPSKDGAVLFYVSSDGSHWIINRDVITAGESGITSQTTDQVDSTIPITDTIQGFNTLQRSDGTYGIRYALQDADGNISSWWQGYNADNSLANASPVDLSGTPQPAIDATPAGDSAPAGGAFVRVFEQINGTNNHFLRFRSYNLDGTANTNIGGGTGTFTLNATNTNVTDITQVNFQQFSAAGGGAFVVVSSELRTDGMYHVVFRFDDNGTVTPTTVAMSANPLNVRISKNENDGSTIIGWSDEGATGVTLAKFDSTGAQVAVTGIDNTFTIDDGQFVDLTNFGDGRVGVGFRKFIDSNTTQDVVDIVDLRTGAVSFDGSGFAANGHYNYAGTQFNDTFLGSDTSTNLYDGAGGSDIFRFDMGAVSGNFNEIVDYDQGTSGSYNAAEGDQIDVSAIVQTALRGGQAAGNLVKIVGQGAGAELFVDADGTANGVAWTPLAQLDGIHVGNQVNVIFDSAVTAGTDVTVKNNAANDFNGDGVSDILLRDSSSGTNVLWTMSNGGISNSGTIANAPSGFTIPGVADFNGDGTTDILLRDDTTGGNVVWTMSGGAVSGTGELNNAPSGWSIAGMADFNADNNTDLLWRNSSTGGNVIWTLNGSSVTSAVEINNVPSDWAIESVADFTGDGGPDILLRNASNGTNFIWTMTGTSVTGGALLNNAPSGWEVAATGDFNGDNTADILMRQASTGTNLLWTINNGAISNSQVLNNAPSNWTVESAADFNGDGTSDILLRDASTGTNLLWTMSNGNISSSDVLPNLSSDWSVASVADFNGDGSADLLWRNSSTGSSATWTMNGATVASSQSLFNIPSSYTVASPGQLAG